MCSGTAALTIAGSDSGGGAGIQADIKTFSALGVFATSVLTAITAQNLAGVAMINGVNATCVSNQIQAVLSGFPIKAIKTGMLWSRQTIAVIATALAQHPAIPLVIDPVLISTSGFPLISAQAIAAMKRHLFPRACLLTPNIPEAQCISGCTIGNARQMETVAHELFARYGIPILLKGGHLAERALDILVDEYGIVPFESPFIRGVNTHGSGCTLAAAITAYLARGLTLRAAIAAAKTYINGSLIHALQLDTTVRVINHFWQHSPPKS